MEEINAKAPAGTEKVKLDPKWLTNHSFWWGWDGVRLADVYVNREIDVCLGRLEGFKPDMVSEYPVFRDPETMLPGTSICRTGFPFTNVAADFDEKCNAFRIRPGVLPIAFFPNDGIHTRNIITSQSSKDGGYQVMYVETSTPGTKGMPKEAAAAAASATPPTVSWSVSARRSTPQESASETSSVGDSVPSDAVECVWRSGFICSCPDELPAGGKGRPSGPR